MQFAFQALDNVQSVNSFDGVSEITFVRGNPGQLYFRLIQETTECDDPLSHRLRYIPPTGTTVTMYFEHIDLAKCFNRVASQPFPTQDASIWLIQLMPCDIFQPNSMRVQMVQPNMAPLWLLPVSDISQINVDSRRFYA